MSLAKLVSGRHVANTPVWVDDAREQVPVLIAAGDWLVVADRGGRLRAVHRDGAPPLFVVHERAVDAGRVVARLRHLAVVEQRGIASFAEVAERTAAERARMDAHVALALAKEALLGDVTPIAPWTLEIDADGGVHRFRDLDARQERGALYDVFVAGAAMDHDLFAVALRRALHLDLSLEEPGEQRELRQRIKRCVRFALERTAEAFAREVHDIESAAVTAGELAQVVRGLFPERVAAERAFIEEIGVLDWTQAASTAAVSFGLR